jgi:hypothetical protein
MEIRSQIAPAFIQSAIEDKYYMVVDGKWIEISKDQYENRANIKWIQTDKKYSETNK